MLLRCGLCRDLAYELVVAFSRSLLLLTAFDVFIVVLTWREYGIHRERRLQRSGTGDKG